MLKKFIAIIGVILSTSAFAETDPFLGWNIMAASGYQHNNTNWSAVSSGYTFTDGSMDYSPLILGVGYTTEINKDYLIGFDFRYNATDTNSMSSYSSGASLYEYVTIKNQMSIGISPGIKFNKFDKEGVIYARLAYISANTHFVRSDGASAPPDKNIDGYELGLGAKIMFDKKLFIFSEYNDIKYNSKAHSSYTGTTTFNIKESGKSFLFGIGKIF